MLQNSHVLIHSKWDLLIFDSKISVDQLDSLRNQNPSLPLIPWPGVDNFCQFEMKSVVKFLLLSLELKRRCGFEDEPKKSVEQLESDDCPIIGQSKLILSAIKNAKRVASSEANVFYLVKAEQVKSYLLNLFMLKVTTHQDHLLPLIAQLFQSLY